MAYLYIRNSDRKGATMMRILSSITSSHAHAAWSVTYRRSFKPLLFGGNRARPRHRTAAVHRDADGRRFAPRHVCPPFGRTDRRVYRIGGQFRATHRLFRSVCY